MKLVSRASPPGLIVGFLRTLCNGLCTAQIFHTEEHDHTRRVGGVFAQLGWPLFVVLNCCESPCGWSHD